MYDYLKGILTTIYPNAVVMECYGVGYLVHVSNPFFYSAHLKKETTVYIHQVVREDAITLYGFYTQEERDLFLKLLSVTGIGPKSALSILANGDIDGLVQAINSDNLTYLTKFPGVGKKTAGQLILDLKGKVGTTNSTMETSKPVTVQNSLLDDVSSALLGLGYSAKEVQKIMPSLEKETYVDTSQALKQAFKLLLGKK